LTFYTTKGGEKTVKKAGKKKDKIKETEDKNMTRYRRVWVSGHYAWIGRRRVWIRAHWRIVRV
jgi:hypothetical protein